MALLNLYLFIFAALTILLWLYSFVYQSVLSTMSEQAFDDDHEDQVSEVGTSSTNSAKQRQSRVYEYFTLRPSDSRWQCNFCR